MKLEILKNMGIRWTLYRTQYEIKKKFGYLENAYKPVNLDSVYIGENINKELVSKTLKKNLSQLNNDYIIIETDKNTLLERANNILELEFLYFSHKLINFQGWNYSPKTKEFAPDDEHWSKISDFNSNFGDIKWIWELNRFTFVYDLARAYIYTNESRYVEKFWHLFEDFVKHNPLEIGVNYKCSQEMSFRVNAWIFALYHFVDHPSSSDTRIETLLKYISHYADHIYKHINFSVEAVKNNHSISEATTLTIIGNTFDFFTNSTKLYKKGIKILEKEIGWQVKEDGTFIQHSHNYHRLVLQNLSWYITSTLSVNKTLSSVVKNKAQLSINYFLNVISDNGEVPNYGMNDGSYIMPLTEREYEDYRPVLQCLNYQLNQELLFEDRYVNEILYLLNDNVQIESLSYSKVEDKNIVINEQGGYHILRHGDFKVFLKSKTYKDRPVQADMNHVDIWYGNQCIFGDAGTYSYNDDEKVLDYFNGTFSHNTVLINNENQMIKGSRFIWFNWSKSKKPIITKKEDSITIKAELLNYNGYRHIRVITLSDDEVMLEDKVVNSKKICTDVKLQWLTELKTKIGNNNDISIDDNSWKLKISSESSSNIKVYSGNEDEYRGWISSTYGEKHPANQIVYHTKSTDEVINIKSVLTKV